MTPDWILDVLAAIMLMVAAVSAARLVAARPWPRGAVVTDISHLLMGIAMAGMLVSGLTTLPNDAWVAVFAVLTAWFGYRVGRDYRASGARALAVGHCAPHLVHSAAMVYMFLAIKAPAASGMGRMSGMPTLSVPTLAFLFALILAGYTIWDLHQLSSLRHGTAAAIATAENPALAGASAGTAVTTGSPPVMSAGGGPIADPAEPSPASGAARRGSGTGSGGFGLMAVLDSPGTVVGGGIALGVTMALMLFLMI
jgi:hypothetical protein